MIYLFIHTFIYVIYVFSQGQTIDDIPKQLLEDACQLVKANSIQGCKLAEVKVVYTMWSNLKKLPGMKPGEVAFLNPSSVCLYSLLLYMS